MGLVKTRRLAAMQKQQRAKMARGKCGNVKVTNIQYPVSNTNLKGNNDRSSK